MDRSKKAKGKKNIRAWNKSKKNMKQEYERTRRTWTWSNNARKHEQ
jgi:hypothetical protein